jgi:Domain of unknown function (DUF4111)/Nucleotidyltransferase domain
MTRPGFPTPYPHANALANALLAGQRDALGANAVGLYLLGSLASGDYDPTTSDVDCLAVTRERVDARQFDALDRMHAALRGSGLPGATNIECAYIPLANLPRYRAEDAHPWLGSDGHFAWETQNSDWIFQRHIAREQGVIVSGPDPRELIDPVPPEALKAATASLLREWWAWQVDDHRNLRDDEYQAYAVLTACRARYTLATGGIASKPTAARWLAAQEPRFATLINRALAWRPGMRMAALDETAEMLRATLALV